MNDDENSEKLKEMRGYAETASLCADQIIEGIRLQAKFMRAKYAALVEEGFTAAEALEIIKAREIE